MGLLSNITAMASNAGDLSQLLQKAQKAFAVGAKPGSPAVREIQTILEKMIPDSKGALDMVQKIDDLIPDAVQSKFGFTPEIMAFIKRSLGTAPASAAIARK